MRNRETDGFRVPPLFEKFRVPSSREIGPKWISVGSAFQVGTQKVCYDRLQPGRSRFRVNWAKVGSVTVLKEDILKVLLIFACYLRPLVDFVCSLGIEFKVLRYFFENIDKKGLIFFLAREIDDDTVIVFMSDNGAISRWNSETATQPYPDGSFMWDTYRHYQNSIDLNGKYNHMHSPF